MVETSARLLRLLSLLQAQPEWSGARLAERLGVTGRTVRRDVERLRALGYPVHSATGTAGGYRLGAGARLPPLLLDDEEAVAVAVGLRGAVGAGVRGVEEASVRALAKLEQVLPHRLRRQVAALDTYTVPMRRAHPGPEADPATLTELAHACRDRRTVRFDYRSHSGDTSSRTAQPHRLVSTYLRWYLVAWDTDRADWRTFRADRITLRPPHGPAFAPRTPPAEDLGAYVSEGVSTGPYRVRGTVLLHTPIAEAARCIPPSVGVLEAVDERRCLLRTGAWNWEQLVAHILVAGVDFEVREPAELRVHVAALRDRLGRAAEPPEAG